MIERRRLTGSAATALLAAVLLTACSGQNQSDDDGLATFSSMDDAYAAVDEVLQCEADPAGRPIVPADEGKLTSEQRLCAENVQVDLYADAAALQTAYEIWSNSHQGTVQLVRGANWMVVDVTDVATGEPSTWDIERVADELNGEYSAVGS